MDSSVTAMLNSLKKELKKEFIEIDGQGRPERYFQAPVHTRNGDDCLVTQVAYPDAASTVVIKSKEYIGTWDSTYDI